MQRFTTIDTAIDYIFHSRRAFGRMEGMLDEDTRDPSLTRRLLHKADLLTQQRQYAVVTGSKGKGSTTVILAKVLQTLGHRVGMITSPHLQTWCERIRVNGRMIPEVDFLRILSDLAPVIDEITATLNQNQYLSPQGVFLAVAVQWFDEQDVAVAVLEVGRGGRFDDIAVVPNQLSLFTTIFEEHTQYMGSLERIAWHKAGIIKPNSLAISVPQSEVVLDRLQAEADVVDAVLQQIAPADMGSLYVRMSEAGDALEGLW